MDNQNPGFLTKALLTWKVYLVPDDKTDVGRIRRAKALGFESKYLPILVFVVSLFGAMAIVIPNSATSRSDSYFKILWVIGATYLLATLIATALTLISGKGCQSGQNNKDSAGRPDA
jgi:hypothetical protein